MQIKELQSGLLVAPIEILYNGCQLMVEDVVIDTGAVRSIIHVDAVEPLDINPSPTDQISRMYGVGGEEFSFVNVSMVFVLSMRKSATSCSILDG